jgi:rsbT co-antagonist protein RsbR
MWERLIASNLEDRDEARRARLLNVLVLSFLLGMILFSATGLALWLWGEDVPAMLFVGTPVIVVLILSTAYALNRSGRLQWAVWVFLGLLNVMLLGLLLVLGHRSAMPMFIPISVLAAAVLTHQRVAFPLAVVWIVIYSAVVLSEVNGWHEPLMFPVDQPFPPQMLIIGRILAMGLMGVLAWLAAGNLIEAINDARRNLERAQLNEADLERARQSLTQQVRERTRDLENALVDVQESMLEQSALLKALRAQTIPVVPLFRQVIAVPVIGMLDAARVELLLSSLLEGIEQYDARLVLLDITGVPVVDEAAAQGLAEVIGGARLLGAECVIVGVNPEIAGKLVDLDVDLSWLTSRGDMEAGLRYAMQRLHRTLDGAAGV